MRQLICPEPREGVIVTLNKTGYMLTNPEEYNQAFIDFSANVSGECLEIGAAYGLATIPALTKGAHIVANDLSEDHLNILKNSVSELDLHRLILKPGKFPEGLAFEDERFFGILASRVLNFIQPDLLQEAIGRIFKWLKKNGKFFVLVSTPYMGVFKSYLPVYEKKKKAGEIWPGFIKKEEIEAHISIERSKHFPESLCLFDLEEIRDLLEGVGFVIEKIGYSIVETVGAHDMRVDGREHVGAIAVKL